MVVLPSDILQSVPPVAEQDYDIVPLSESGRRGYFSGLDVPDLVTADIRDFIHTPGA